MKKKKIIIIGAGVSGLSAGIHALLKGFDVEIYESHRLAGGLCTAWQRNGYTIDGCIHWITGSKKGSDLYKIWENCGALGDEISLVHHDYISSYRDHDGYHYLYSDLEKLRKEFLTLSPEDADHINELVKIVRVYEKMPLPANKPQELMNLIDKIRFYTPYIKAGKYFGMASKTSIGAYISRFRSPVIRQMLAAVVPNMQLSANAFFFTLATFSMRDGGWPAGGSSAMAERMKERFLSLGGRIHLGKPAKKIIIENGKAIGIELNNNESAKADYIVPTVSVDILLEQLLEGKYKDAFFEERFADRQNYQLLSTAIIALGVDAGMREYPHSLAAPLQRPLRINQTEIEECFVYHYCFEPSFAPQGKSLMEVNLNDAEFEYWRNLKATSPEDYKAKKRELASAVVSEIETIYPDIKGKIEILDVATPLTFHRYCGTHQGSYMSFCSTPKSDAQTHQGAITGIENLYLAGQWALPQGGLPMAAIAGKFAIQRICKREKISVEF
ncbi:NAD(P)/FAD-dependent oxidoreductase [Bacteroidales bacterium OttesenSCG-928-J16]|nr:NAD(P)/FAD-dependent oxidoreductase [Bacteroidales bacterium OttesenSCG-928-J16]